MPNKLSLNTCAHLIKLAVASALVCLQIQYELPYKRITNPRQPRGRPSPAPTLLPFLSPQSENVSVQLPGAGHSLFVSDHVTQGVCVQILGGISKAFRCSAEILYQGSEGSTMQRQFIFCLTHCPSPTLLVYHLILESGPGTGEKWIISYSCHKAGETPHLKNSKWLLGQEYFLFRI